MEVEPRVVARLLVDEGRYAVEVTEEVLPYFKTLANMMKDLQGDLSYSDVIDVPVIDSRVTAPLLQTMIQFYRAYVKSGMEAVEKATRGKVTTTDYTESQLLFALYARFSSIVDNTGEMGRLAAVADFLDTTELLLFVVDALFVYFERLDWVALQRLYARLPDIKRQRTDRILLAGGAPLRVQYKRREMIRAMVSAFLSESVLTLLPARDERMKPYIPQLVASKFMTLIRQLENEPVFLRHSYTMAAIQLDSSVLPLSQGEGKVYSARSDTEIIMTDLSYVAIRPDNGVTVWLGELGDTKPLLSTVSTGFLDIITAWPGSNSLIVLTHAGLRWTGIVPHGVSIADTEPLGDLPFRASDILDVSCGNLHALILTTQGLYGWGSNQSSQLDGATDIAMYTKPTKLEGFVPCQKICCRANYSIVLSTSNRLYLTGFFGGTTYMGWQELANPAASLGAPVMVLTGNDEHILIASVNNIWESVRVGQTILFPVIMTQQKEPFVEVVYVTPERFLVATSDSLLLVGLGTPATLLKEFGGATIQADNMQHLLKMPFKSYLPLAEATKKPALQCQRCLANAVFVDEKTHRTVFCSHYCLYKSSMRLSRT